MVHSTSRPDTVIVNGSVCVCGAAGWCGYMCSVGARTAWFAVWSVVRRLPVERP